MSHLTVTLDMYGSATEAAASVEILGKNLAPVERRWMDGNQPETFVLDPGKYGLRTVLPSGRTFEKVIEIREGEALQQIIPTHLASPHESHEWAYLTQDIDAAGSRLLSEAEYAGMWIRLWSRASDLTWKVNPLDKPNELSANEDGVSFGIQLGREKQYLLQIGGDNIPWKFAALPPDKLVMVLIRPASGPADRVHPVEVVVSSDDWKLESLLSLLSRGNTDHAEDLLKRKSLAAVAEAKLYSKIRDPYSAVIGGYALLQLDELEKMHTWAKNLANWFEWIPDGAVIHGSQLLYLARAESNQTKRIELIDRACKRYLEAEHRGIPLITKGLHRLRDGLLTFHHAAEGKNAEVKAALTRIGAVTAAADPASSTTIFTGSHPDKPTPEPPSGPPKDHDPISYIYDIPLAEVMDTSKVAVGTELSSELLGEDWSCRITDNGSIDLSDGRTFESIGAMQKALVGHSKEALRTWHIKGKTTTIEDLVHDIRFSPRMSRR